MERLNPLPSTVLGVFQYEPADERAGHQPIETTEKAEIQLMSSPTDNDHQQRIEILEGRVTDDYLERITPAEPTEVR